MRNMVNQRKWILIAEDIGMGAAVFSITQLLIRIPILQNVLAYQPWFQVLPYASPFLYGLFLAATAGLAEGAVIPPNREFMAVLGDQKSGTNIETPLETMVQAFKQAMNESGGRSQTIILQLNGREFARAVYKANNEETQRVGVRLAGVKA